MKKYICLLLAIIITVSFCSCSKSKGAHIDLTEAPDTTQAPSESNSDATSETEAITETEPTSQSSLAEEMQNSETRTFYCDDPNNKYITGVAEKYGIPKSSLVALIRVKSKTPGATVLQFSGKTDSNGNLITTQAELKAIYEIADADSTVRKATGKFTGYEGYNYTENLAVYELTKRFILPNLADLKKTSPYKGK